MSSSFVFQSPEGCEFPMKFQRPQLAGLVSQFEKEVGHGQAVPPPEHRILVAPKRCSIRPSVPFMPPAPRHSENGTNSGLATSTSCNASIFHPKINSSRCGFFPAAW
jgi:hypothetical protein